LTGRRLTRVERRFIRSGAGDGAARLYRRRLLSLIASMIAGPAGRGPEYSQVKLELLELYRDASSRRPEIGWLDRAYPAAPLGILRELRYGRARGRGHRAGP